MSGNFDLGGFARLAQSLSDRGWLAIQGVGTLSILASPLPNFVKAVLLLALWKVSFRGISRPEWMVFAIANVFFTIMNILSLRQGIFFFVSPDLLGLPYYEFFMWGFYLLHLKRVLNGPLPPPADIKLWLLFVAFAACFSAIHNPYVLLLATGGLVGWGLYWHHDNCDLQHVLYTVALGGAIEYIGVHSGEWAYPGDPPGGVPFWFVTLWGGIGFFFRRLILPLLAETKITIDESGQAPGRL